MIYIFENEVALELYYKIVYELDIKIYPQTDELYTCITEQFMQECLDDLMPTQTS